MAGRGKVGGKIGCDGCLAGSALWIEDDDALHVAERLRTRTRCRKHHARLGDLVGGVCERTHAIRPREQLESCSMERLLLLWDEIDDLVGTSRYMVKNTAIAIWSSVRKR